MFIMVYIIDIHNFLVESSLRVRIKYTYNLLFLQPMKKMIFIAIFILAVLGAYSQHKQYVGKVFDGITFQPLSGASIYNVNTKKFAFTDKDGRFTIPLSLNDTLIISKSIYRQLVVCVNQNVYAGMEDFFLYYKATMLKEVRIIAINPSYEGFKKDIVTMELPEYYKRAEDVKLSEFEKANATFQPNGNLLSLGGSVTMSPISYIYDKFSHKSKMNRLYNEMLSYEEETERIQDKYNREIVSNLTGLKGEELVNFMMYCRFSYYDLVRMDDEKIRDMIKAKYFEYEYNKIKEEEPKIKIH